MGIGFISLTPPLSGSNPLSTFRIGHDAVVPEIGGGGLAANGPLHRVFEEDRGQDLAAGERRRGHDALRIWWTRSNISSSSSNWVSGTP